MGKKRFFEGYSSLTVSSYVDQNFDPPQGRVYIILSVDVSMENKGFVGIYFGDRRDSWLPAYKIIERYSGDNTVSIDKLWLVVTDQDRVKIRVSNGSTSSFSTVYLNVEYLDLSQEEFDRLKEKLREEYGVI